MKSSPLVLAGLLAASLSTAAEQKTSTTLIKAEHYAALKDLLVQVVVGRGSKEGLIKGLQAVADDVNGRDLWTMQDTATAKEILKAIR